MAKISIEIERLARAFSETLKTALSDYQISEVIRRNRITADKSVCHSHDYCDANMIMLNALKTCGIDVENNEDAWAWVFDSPEGNDTLNKAWDIAKANEFYFEAGS